MGEQELRDGLAYVHAVLADMHTRAEARSLTDDEQRAWDEGIAYVEETQRTLRRYDEARALAARPGHIEPSGAPNVVVKGDPFEALRRRPDQSDREYRQVLADGLMRSNEDRIEGGDNQSHFEGLVKRHSGDHRWAANLLARSRDEYAEGFSKLVTGREAFLTDEERAAMAVGTNTAGGYLVPTHLDPSLIMTNSGSSNVIRSLARVVTLTQGSTWNGVTTAGSTASWDGELVEVSDDTPAVARVSVNVYSARALVQASIEAFEDISGLAGDVAMILADAKDRLEGAAHATGSGSSQPTGIFTALDANTNVEVSATTANAIGLVDLHNLYRSVPVRWRGRGSWLMNPVFSLGIKALGTAVSASYSTDITQAMAGSLLGRPVVESDDAPSTQTTTAQDAEIVYGDFSNFVVVDKPGGTSIEFIPHMLNTSNNLPDGRRAWFMHWRNGSDSVNDLAFRLLIDKTSA